MQKPTEHALNRARLGVLSAWALRGAFEEGATSSRPFFLAGFAVALGKDKMPKRITEHRKRNRKPAQATRKSPRLERNQKARTPRKTRQAQAPDEVPTDYYLESLFPCGTVQGALEQRGYTNVQVAPDAVAGPGSFTVNMRVENDALDAAGVRRQLDQIVKQIPETEKYHITWRVLQSVAIVQGAEVAAAIKVEPLRKG